jgi:hypothetical protein
MLHLRRLVQSTRSGPLLPPVQTALCPQFDAGKRVNARQTALNTGEMQPAVGVAVAVAAGRLHQAVDLPLGKVFAGIFVLVPDPVGARFVDTTWATSGRPKLQPSHRLRHLFKSG